MESENLTCGVCSLPYDAADHIPRVLINCGHTLCTSCLIEILKSPNLRKCPFDSILFKRSQNTLDHFPSNFVLSAFLEERHRNICQIHDDQLAIVCLKDKIKICRDCALFGEHKGHPMKSIKELKAQGNKMKKDLEESLSKFKKFQLEKDQEVDVLEEEFLREMKKKFKEMRDMLKAKEIEWTKEAKTLFERKVGSAHEDLLIDDAEKALEEIDQACQKEENLTDLDQDFSSIMSRLQAPNGEEEVFNLSIKGSRIMESMNIFFMDQANSIKSFDLLNERKKAEQKENLVEIKEKSPGVFKTKTLFTLEVCNNCLFIKVKNQNPVDLTIDFGAFPTINKISIELEKYLSFFQGSANFTFLSEILHQLNNYTSLAVSFIPEGLTDYRALGLLNPLFSRIENLIEIDISFEQCEVTNQPISFFCMNILPKAVSLTNLSLELGSTLVSDLSLFELAKSLAPLSKNLESFTLGAENTAINDNGIDKILNVILGVKVLDLNLKGTLVTDKSLKVLGNNMMPCMKNLQEFVLNCSDTKITTEGVCAVLRGIPNGIRWLELDFKKVRLSEEIVSLFEEQVCPKLGLVKEMHLSLGRSDLEAKIGEMLEAVRKEAWELNKEMREL